MHFSGLCAGKPKEAYCKANFSNFPKTLFDKDFLYDYSFYSHQTHFWHLIANNTLEMDLNIHITFLALQNKIYAINIEFLG